MASSAFKNFRDLGGIRASGGVVKKGHLFRTAHLSYLDQTLAAELKKTHGPRTYVDFRTDEEIARDGRPEPLLALGVRWERRPFDIADPIFLGIRLPAPDDWSALYGRAFERLRPVFSAVAQGILSADSPIVFGCWAGKDRTGMVAALLLSLLGVDDEAIAEDYARTTAGLRSIEGEFSFLARDRPDLAAAFFRAFCEAPPEIMHAFLDGLRARFGSAQAALDLPDAVVLSFRRKLLE